MTHKMKITLIAGGIAAGLLLLGGAGYAHYSHHHGADGWRNGAIMQASTGKAGTDMANMIAAACRVAACTATGTAT